MEAALKKKEDELRKFLEIERDQLQKEKEAELKAKQEAERLLLESHRGSFKTWKMMQKE